LLGQSTFVAANRYDGRTFCLKLTVMSFLDTVKHIIGNDVFSRLEKEADKEVGLAMQMDLLNQYGDKQYYRKRFLLGEFLQEHCLFQEKGLKISPLDLFEILFESKILFAPKDEKGFLQRSGMGMRAIGFWRHRSLGIEEVINRRFEGLQNSQEERVLLTQVNSYHGEPTEANAKPGVAQGVFEGIFVALEYAFLAFLYKDEDLPARYSTNP
jgi:hypothetical protein